VPCIIIGNKKDFKLRDGGVLGDVAPTLLELLGLPQPEEMTGKSLIEK
jgi:2,3-bisphosphoglycerate-independent phosphoglycerate mutase